MRENPSINEWELFQYTSYLIMFLGAIAGGVLHYYFWPSEMQTEVSWIGALSGGAFILWFLWRQAAFVWYKWTGLRRTVRKFGLHVGIGAVVGVAVFYCLDHWLFFSPWTEPTVGFCLIGGCWGVIIGATLKR